MSSELSFRTQLGNPQQRQLYDYWRACAGDRALPARHDILPEDIAQLLPNVSLMEVDGEIESLKIRLAGTEIRDIYGFEPTGRYLFQCDLGTADHYWRMAYQRLLHTGLPGHGIVKGPMINRDHLILNWLRLPLSGDGRRIDMILCYDSAVSLMPKNHAKALLPQPNTALPTMPVLAGLGY